MEWLIPFLLWLALIKIEERFPKPKRKDDRNLEKRWF